MVTQQLVMDSLGQILSGDCNTALGNGALNAVTDTGGQYRNGHTAFLEQGAVIQL